MRLRVAALMFFFPCVAIASGQANLKFYFSNLSLLHFAMARNIAMQEPDTLVRFELLQLTDMLYYEGQIEKTHFKTVQYPKSSDEQTDLLALRALNEGYLSLFYDQVKGNAFRSFYRAYQLAKKTRNEYLIKACLMGFLKYYNLEIAQNSDSYYPYLKHFETLQQEPIDEVWTIVYKMIFYSKAIGRPDPDYFKLSDKLKDCEKMFQSDSAVMAYVFYEKGIVADLGGNLKDAEKYFKKTFEYTSNYPFLRYHRFFSLLKLMIVECRKQDFVRAKHFLQKAKTEASTADSLRSSYHLNLFGSYYLNAAGKYDSAYSLLMTAYEQEFQLDFRRNTLEINRLTVELETQEKENSNLRLRQNAIWLVSALVVLGLLSTVTYFAYINQRAKIEIQSKEKQMQAIKLEKVLKDQELFGIDSMIAGQERERQRIANDLHDNLGSLLATLKLHFQNLLMKNSAIDSEQHLLLQKADDLLEEAYQRVRSIAHLKNSGVNAQDGLMPAVKTFASKVSIINRLVLDVKEHGMDERLENSLEITIFRIIQELITNVIKHANATEATIHLTHYDDSINLIVEDNGIGFSRSQIRPDQGMGLHSIQKRIENLGGVVTVDSIPERGTSIIIDIPLI